MNRKILVSAIVVAMVLSIVAFVGLTTISSDVLPTGDDKITSRVHGTPGNFTESELAGMAKIIILGDVQSVELVEQKDHPTAQYKMVFSYIEIKPTEILKGTPVLNDKGNVLLRVPGGETANYRTESDMLPFSENDHVFLYLGMNKEETSTYIPVGSETMFVIRDGQAKDNMGNLTDLDDLLSKHRDIIRGLS